MKYADYEQTRRTLIEYLRMKVAVEDWHGVADAANDLRELDAAEAARVATGASQ